MSYTSKQPYLIQERHECNSRHLSQILVQQLACIRLIIHGNRVHAVHAASQSHQGPAWRLHSTATSPRTQAASCPSHGSPPLVCPSLRCPRRRLWRPCLRTRFSTGNAQAHHDVSHHTNHTTAVACAAPEPRRATYFRSGCLDQWWEHTRHVRDERVSQNLGQEAHGLLDVPARNHVSPGARAHTHHCNASSVLGLWVITRDPSLLHGQHRIHEGDTVLRELLGSHGDADQRDGLHGVGP